MGFNKKYVRELTKLEEEYAELGHEKFRQTYLKADALIGSTESMSFIHKVVYDNKQHKPKKKRLNQKTK